MSIAILDTDRYLFNDCVRLVQAFYKEYSGVIIHRIEAEEILKENSSRCLVVDGIPKGLYVFSEKGEVNVVKAFILDRTVRMKKKGYLLWKDMEERLGGKPIIVCAPRRNEAVIRFLQKRGMYIGSGIGDSLLESYDCYNISRNKRKD